MHDVCVGICLFFCASIRFICKTFIQIFYLLLPEPCLVDMDCMDSVCSLLISAESRGFYTRIFVNNNYYSWQCNINRKNNGKLVEKFYFSRNTFLFIGIFKKKRKKRANKITWLLLINTECFPKRKTVTTLYLRIKIKLRIKIMNLQVQNHLNRLLSNFLYRSHCANILNSFCSSSSIQPG